MKRISLFLVFISPFLSLNFSCKSEAGQGEESTEVERENCAGISSKISSKLKEEETNGQSEITLSSSSRISVNQDSPAGVPYLKLLDKFLQSRLFEYLDNITLISLSQSSRELRFAIEEYLAFSVFLQKDQWRFKKDIDISKDITSSLIFTNHSFLYIQILHFFTSLVSQLQQLKDCAEDNLKVKMINALKRKISTILLGDTEGQRNFIVPLSPLHGDLQRYLTKNNIDMFVQKELKDCWNKFELLDKEKKREIDECFLEDAPFFMPYEEFKSRTAEPTLKNTRIHQMVCKF